MKAVKKAKKEMCNNTNNNEWSHCQLCDGREHLPTCTTKKVKGKDCVCGGVDYKALNREVEAAVKAKEQLERLHKTFEATTKLIIFLVVLWLLGFISGVVLSVLFPTYTGRKVSDYSSRVSGPEPRREFAKIESQPNFNVSVLSVEDQIRTTLRIEGLEHLSATFIKVAFYESTLNPRAVGYASKPNSGFYGLFQIYTGTWNGYGCEGDIFNAMDNTACAVKIYRREGFAPWEVYTDGLI